MPIELKYIIKITDATRYEYYIGNGGSYQFQGEKYAVVVERADEAKKNTSPLKLPEMPIINCSTVVAML